MKTWLAPALMLALLPLAAAAQQIPVKTVPVATGDQFLLFPSQNMGMGGVSIALDDPLYDPFVNPAKGIHLQGVRFTSAPVYYGISIDNNFFDDASSGRTLPVGMMLRQGTLFGGAMIAWQELHQDNQDGCCVVFDALRADEALASSIRPRRSSTSANNVYAFAMGGAQLPGTNLSVGASAFVAGLNGLEGVRLLYVDGNRVKQTGDLSAFRLGFYNQWDDGRSAELIVLHHRFTMKHEFPVFVTFEDDTAVFQRVERDETRGWAVQLGVQQPLDNGWRLGGRLVGDWKHHPKIPNYDLMQIPRDPGNSSAYNAGVGFSRTVGSTTYGIDVVYEPIWSHTWANALDDTPTTGTGPPEVVRAGEMTVENHFRFDNSIVRLGLQQTGDVFDFGFGVGIHTYRYHLDQENFVGQFTRDLDESWSEWTASLGLGFHFTHFQVRYLSLLTLGTGRPGIERTGVRRQAQDVAFAANDFLVAPSGPLALESARVWTHQVTVIVPLTD